MGTTSFEVHLGTTDITDLAEPGHIVLSTQNSLMHEQSNTIFVDNDLGIIFLPSSVTGPNIVPIRLPAYSQVNETYVGQVGRASGWGLTSDDATQYSPLLKFVDLTVISDAVCKPFWAENSIHDGNFCVRTSLGYPKVFTRAAFYLDWFANNAPGVTIRP
ncbi:hypothetical protein B566_EDAN004887 [Ephemera danica]|nr:hypothetical protein B566_EDAN004887 [Ephemera danica]